MTVFICPNAEDFLMGLSQEMIMLRGPTSVIPTEIMSKRQYYAIGRVMQLMEVHCHVITLKYELKLNMSSQAQMVILLFSLNASSVSVWMDLSSYLATASLDLKEI